MTKISERLLLKDMRFRRKKRGKKQNLLMNKECCVVIVICYINEMIIEIAEKQLNIFT